MTERQASPIPTDASALQYKTTGVNLPFDVYELLNRAGFQRVMEREGCPSVSGLLVQLLQRHRKKLEQEIAG